ncbi:MAG: hypothetical protein DRP56_02125 [Planctomycetota bacterium]|nr:MAG: hypothetical protein DRP56_02125 [Planctomycetota bacterium]
MADINKLKVDAKKVSGGVWVDYTDGVRLLIARKPNPAFQEYMADLIEPHLASIHAGTFDDKLDKLLTKKAVAKHVLLGWENIEENGKPIEYSPENAFELFKNEDLVDLYHFVLTIAHSKERYRYQETETAVKN